MLHLSTSPRACFPAALTLVLLLAAGGVAARQGSDGWRIPENAETVANPIAADEKVLEKGREIYRSKCARCHGPVGRGDGSEADPDRPPGDLTDASRAPRNPDGVMFYKIWNGRGSPKMPAFSSDLSRDEVWTVIHYVKTLRKQ
jgi:mono/diheme cytochrome c family protein